MLMMILMLGLVVIVGGVLLSLVFGLALGLLGLAIKIAVVGLVAYFVVRIVSPNTAAALRAKFRGDQSLPRF